MPDPAPRPVPPIPRMGDTVALVAPASPVVPGHLEAGAALLRSWGLVVEVGEHAADRAAPPLGHLAGSDADRAADLLSALTRPGVAAVVCARGGTAVGRVLERLTAGDWAAVGAAEPRWVVGSSDITALHLALAARGLACSAFGPMPATDAVVGGDAEPETLEALRASLLAPLGPASLSGRTEVDGAPMVAPVTGGTLTLVASLLGTADAGSAAGSIVLLEDVGEAPRRLDRALTQMRRSGWLDGAAGVVIGSLHECGDTALDVVLERVGDLGVPVVAGLEVGHGPVQRHVPLGVPARLDPGAGTLSWPA